MRFAVFIQGIIMFFATHILSLSCVYAQRGDETCVSLSLTRIFNYWVAAEEAQYVLNHMIGPLRPFSHYLTTVYFLLQLASYHEKIGNQEQWMKNDQHVRALMKYTGKNITHDMVGFTSTLKSAQYYLDKEVPEYLRFIQDTKEYASALEVTNGEETGDSQIKVEASPPTWPTDKPLQPQAPLPAKNQFPWISVASVIVAMGGFFGLYYLMVKYVYGEVDHDIADLSKRATILHEWQRSKKKDLARYKGHEIHEIMESLKAQKKVIKEIVELYNKFETVTKVATLQTFKSDMEKNKRKVDQEEEDYRKNAHEVVTRARKDKYYADWVGGITKEHIKKNAVEKVKEAKRALDVTFSHESASRQAKVLNAMKGFTKKLKELATAGVG